MRKFSYRGRIITAATKRQAVRKILASGIGEGQRIDLVSARKDGEDVKGSFSYPRFYGADEFLYMAGFVIGGDPSRRSWKFSGSGSRIRATADDGDGHRFEFVLSTHGDTSGINSLDAFKTAFNPDGESRVAASARRIHASAPERVVATDGNIHALVRDALSKYGNHADLNFIDTSRVTDMNNLFFGLKFDGDVSGWDTSRVKDMRLMFAYSKFDGDISNWDTSRVKDMDGMFAASPFNGDISKWDVSSVTCMHGMFMDSDFKGDISRWDVSNVKLMGHMFTNTDFNGDLSGWDVSHVTNFAYMFEGSRFNGDISGWDTSSAVNLLDMFADSAFRGDISGWDTSRVMPECMDTGMGK